MNVKNRRGYLFTIGVILLILPLIFLVSYYISMSHTKSEDTVGKIRCDELHYLINDLKEDMRRGIVIFGRRAAIYSIDQVITSGTALGDYSFNCTEMCGVDCNAFDFSMNGSEAAIAELALCGTFHGENVTYMLNHTLSEWVSRINVAGSNMNFEVNITLANITVVQNDAWNFAVIVDTIIDVSDDSGLCYYRGDMVSIESFSSILGLEDVLYPLNSDGRLIKFITNCTTDLDLETVAGCSLTYGGEGIASGRVLFWSNLKDSTTPAERQTYCSTFGEYVNDKILVTDTAFGNCNSFEQCCFNASCPYHFSGVINYGPTNPESWEKCELTIPWITHTCKLDNETGFGPGGGCERPDGCNESLIGTDACVMIKNDDSCSQHDVLMGMSTANITTSCYSVSNVTSLGVGCLEYAVNGPSFFDRLDGNYNLSEKYVNQSRLYYNTTAIGLETLVDPYILDSFGIVVDDNRTWVDYLYWQDVDGCKAVGSCADGAYDLMMDCFHAYTYSIDTECVNASTCMQSNVTTTSTTTTTVETTTSSTSTSTTIVGSTTSTTSITSTSTTSTSSSTTTSSTTTSLQPCTGFSDDMEAGEDGWTNGGSQNEWELGDPDWGSCHSAGNCWGTDLSSYYNNNANEWLMSPMIDLTTASAPSLTLWEKHRLEWFGDSAYVEISADNGPWENLMTISGWQSSWTQNSISLTDYAGSIVRIRFRLESDGWITFQGLYVDDFSVSCS
ncbi:MAG: hypothetical protein V1921_04690 [Candidatus Altiarchaeota archaeon]